MAGTLYIVATPIGNLDDMPPRVAATFGAADFIAAEDTRVTMKLLNFLGLKKPMVSYYEHALQKGEAILQRIEAGESCALCSDAGMPCVSDPGEVIVRDALARGIKVVPIPAASACVTALAVSGQDTSRWVFEGFLPVNRKQKKERLAELLQEKRTVIFVTNNIEEAVYLGDRIVLLSRCPATIKQIYDVSLPRPRDYVDPEFLAIREAIEANTDLAL